MKYKFFALEEKIPVINLRISFFLQITVVKYNNFFYEQESIYFGVVNNMELFLLFAIYLLFYIN